MTDYKYGDMVRVDKVMDEYTIQGHRPGKVAKLVREMKEATKKVDEAYIALKEIRKKIEPDCTHAVEDMVYSEYGITDTLGNMDYTQTYLNCKLCGTKLFERPL